MKVRPGTYNEQTLCALCEPECVYQKHTLYALSFPVVRLLMLKTTIYSQTSCHSVAM